MKYKSNCLLEVSKINKIKAVNTNENYRLESLFDVVYKIKGISMETYEQAEYETVLRQTKSYIKIKARVDNEFSFIQRILLYGADFTIVSPQFFKDTLIKKLKLIQRNYTS